MRDEIIKRNLIITIVSLLIFFLVSTYIASYSSRKNLEKNLINVSNIVNNQLITSSSFEDINKVVSLYENNDNWLHIVVANSFGIINYNSDVDELEISDKNCLSIEEIKLANDDYLDSERIYVSNDYLCYITKVNDDIILRTAVAMESNSVYILQSMFYLLILIIGVLILNILFTRKTSEMVVEAFDRISSHLKTINEGEYEMIDVNHSFEEVRKSLTEINVINQNISKSILSVKNERDKLDYIINNIEQGLIIIDQNLRILIINQYAANIFEVEKNDCLGHYYNELIKVDILDKNINQVFTSKNPHSFDFIKEEQGKIYRFLISTLETHWDIAEEPLQIITMLISDVTEERHNDEVKAEFIANASHELKTPITVIRGFSELIINGLCENNEQIIEYTKKIFDESIRMKETIDELLYLSNLEYQYNKQKFDEEINLKKIISEVITKYQDLAKKYQVRIDLNCNDTYINGSELLIKHLMNNILENAIKYNKENGSVVINIYETSQKVIYETIDTGQGIETKSIERIFERFYRVEESHNRQTGGTGLGLTIVKKICIIHGAELTVDSKINVGTTLTIKFPKE